MSALSTEFMARRDWTSRTGRGWWTASKVSPASAASRALVTSAPAAGVVAPPTGYLGPHRADVVATDDSSRAPAKSVTPTRLVAPCGRRGRLA